MVRVARPPARLVRLHPVRDERTGASTVFLASPRSALRHALFRLVDGVTGLLAVSYLVLLDTGLVGYGRRPIQRLAPGLRPSSNERLGRAAVTWVLCALAIGASAHPFAQVLRREGIPRLVPLR